MIGDLFYSSTAQPLHLDGASVNYFPAWLDGERATDLQHSCREQLPWEQPDIVVMGKLYKTPRQQVWMGDPEADYRYSGRDFEPVPWFEFLQVLRNQVADFCRTEFNSVLVNRYRDGRDGMGFHADDEAELGRSPMIASVSLGASRKFAFKPKRGNGQSSSLILNHGDLLVMSGTTQEHWLHGLPKTRKPVGERINLTFRLIHKRG